MDTSAIFTCCLLLFSLLTLRYVFGRRHKGPLPPGPKGLPFVGNFFDLPKSYPHKTFMAWGDTWGTFPSLSSCNSKCTSPHSPYTL